jgi:lysophospholipase L1-like esterase
VATINHGTDKSVKLGIPQPILRRFAVVFMLSLAGAAWSATPPDWVTSWMAAPDSAGPALKAQTIRQIVRTSAGGTRVRLRLSNLYGAGPVDIGPVHVALRAGGAAIEPGTGHVLTFGGSPVAAIAKGESILSDPVDMNIPALRELAVSMYLPAGTATSTIHGAGMQTAYIVRGADFTAATSFAVTETDDSRYFLTDVEVSGGDGKSGVVVIVGDSITDGIGSTADSNLRWPDLLAAQLLKSSKSSKSSMAVVNAGIAGNRIVRDAAKPFVGASALSRFRRDALDKPGVSWIVLQEGINDITASDMLADEAQHVSAQQIIDGMQALILRAHENGIRIAGATMLPYGGVKKPFVHSAAGEGKRQAVNAWIRSSGAFDAVIDFDLALRDPAQPERLLPAYDSGDHLHPNDLGYQTMAASAARLLEALP